MSFALSTLVKAFAVAGITGTSIAVPFALPKNINKQEIQFEINYEQFQQIQKDQNHESPSFKEYLPELCRAIAKDDRSYSKVKELILCSFDASPYFYLYETEGPSGGASPKVMVIAKKVKNISNGMGGDTNLSITLEDNTKQDLSPKFRSKWSDAKDLVPERDCAIIVKSPSNKQELSCKNGQINIPLE